MIKNEKPLSMAESLGYLKGEKAKELKQFISKFVEIDDKKGKSIREDLEALDMIKLNEKHVAKIIDVLPEDKETLINLLQDANLDEDEINKILETIKNRK
jgi:DNA-directed RNA polymerase subunit F